MKKQNVARKKKVYPKNRRYKELTGYFKIENYNKKKVQWMGSQKNEGNKGINQRTGRQNNNYPI